MLMYRRYWPSSGIAVDRYMRARAAYVEAQIVQEARSICSSPIPQVAILGREKVGEIPVDHPCFHSESARQIPIAGPFAGKEFCTLCEPQSY